VPGATSVMLGRDLFYDPILSGNRNVSCATCHHPHHGTSDGVSLSLGEGGIGLGPARRPDPDNPPARLARNASALFNLGAAEFVRFFHDGRVEPDDKERFGIRLPQPARLERPLSALAAQVLVHLISPDHVAGHHGENTVADAVAARRITGVDGAWQKLAERVSDIPEYRRRISWLTGRHEPIHIAHIASAIADFIAYEFRSTNSPFDAYLSGDETALGTSEHRGMLLFYGKAGCARCHSGRFQTDHEFHAVGLPQIGPGLGHGAAYADHGRAAVTGKARDIYRFRTPSLRNATLTAPYGHSGAYATLEKMIRQHLDPATGLAEYESSGQAILPGAETSATRQPAMQDFDEVLAIYNAIGITPRDLGKSEIDALISFLGALADPVSTGGRLGIPDTVPSGLPIIRADSGL